MLDAVEVHLGGPIVVTSWGEGTTIEIIQLTRVEDVLAYVGQCIPPSHHIRISLEHQ